MIARATLILFAPILFAFGALAMPALAQPASDAAPDGHRLFVQSCAVCHLKPSPVAKTYGPELAPGIAAGNADMVRAAIVNGSAKMPSFKYDLQPNEIDAIVQYLTKADSIGARACRGDATASGERRFLSFRHDHRAGRRETRRCHGLGTKRDDHDQRL